MKIKLSFCVACKRKPELSEKASNKLTIRKNKSKNVEEEKVDIVEQDVPGYRKIKCPEIANYFTIKYMLQPNFEDYTIECMYFDDVAKIYTPENDVIIKTRISDNIVWICFTIIHFIHLNLDEYHNLMTHNIEIKLTEGAKDLSDRVTTDTERSFYIPENVENKDFIEIYDYVNETDTAVDNICKHVIDDLLNLSCSWVDKQFFLTKLYAISDFMHKKAINKLMNNIVKNEFILPAPMIDLIPIQNPDKPNVKQKKNAKGKKVKVGGPLMVSIKGKDFFIDEFLRKESATISPKANCCYFASICTTSHHLNTYEKCVLNPLVVKLYSIKNLPIAKLLNDGISVIYAMYEIPSHPKTITNGYNIDMIDDKLQLNDFQIFLTNHIESINFVEYFQTQSLDIDFYGLRNVEKDTKHLFGEDIKDTTISKPLTITKATYILSNSNQKAVHIPLFRLKIKLNELFKQVENKNYPKDTKPYNTNFNNTQKVPLDILSEDCVHFIEPDYEMNQTNTNRNLCVRLLQSNDLLKYNIKVNYRVKVYSNLNTRFYHALTSNAPIYHRIFIKLDASCGDFTKCIVTRIIMWNNVVHDLKRDGLSGFIATNDKYTVIFVEGLHNSYINTIWSMIYDKKINNCIILYDTKLLFTKRVYIDETEDFFYKPKIFFTIRMSSCYTKILSTGGFFLTSNTCEKIVRKIDLLSNATSMEEICQNNLLPTLNMMKSLKTGNSVCDINLLFQESSTDELTDDQTGIESLNSSFNDSKCCIEAISAHPILVEVKPENLIINNQEKKFKSNINKSHTK